jgi:hypothetical protein
MLMVTKLRWLAGLTLASALLAQAPAGAALASQTLAGLDTGTVLRSIRLTGSVTRHFAAPVTGTAVLEAAGPTQARVEFDFPDGSRVETRGDDAQGRPWGAWADASGTAHAMALANCWVPAAWFLPQLAVLTPGHAGETLSMLADASGAHRLERVRAVAHQTTAMTAEIERLSAAVLSVDAAPGLPAALAYTLRPDNGGPFAIPVEIRYSDYRTVNGVEIPFHIQEFMQRALDYDIEIQDAEVNPALDASGFAEPAAVAASYAQRPSTKGATK